MSQASFITSDLCIDLWYFSPGIFDNIWKHSILGYNNFFKEMVRVVFQWVDTEDADKHTTVLKVAFPSLNT